VDVPGRKMATAHVDCQFVDDKDCKPYSFQCGANSANASFGVLEFVFPYADNPPSAAPQFLAYGPVAFDVSREFVSPKRTVAYRKPRMLWTTVPKATVDKQSKTAFQKHEVWRTKDRKMTAPATETMPPEQFC
jgi:hypothetical protein